MWPLSSTTRAVITLVTLAIGRSMFRPRPHSTWPVAASASTAPLAFTPRGAPVTSITGLAGGRGRATDARDRDATAATCSDADRAPDLVSVAAHAAMPPPVTAAAAITATIRAVSRMAWLNSRYRQSVGVYERRPPDGGVRCHTLPAGADTPETPAWPQENRYRAVSCWMASWCSCRARSRAGECSRAGVPASD